MLQTAQLNFITLVLLQHILKLDRFHQENVVQPKNDRVVIILSHVHKYMLQSPKKIHCLFGKCWFPFAAQNFIVYDPPLVAMNQIVQICGIMESPQSGVVSMCVFRHKRLARKICVLIGGMIRCDYDETDLVIPTPTFLIET